MLQSFQDYYILGNSVTVLEGHINIIDLLSYLLSLTLIRERDVRDGIEFELNLPLSD